MPFMQNKPRVKAKLCLLGLNYFIIFHQAGVNFENFAKVKLRDILLNGTGHRDRRLNRDCPGQTGTYGRSSFKRNSKSQKIKFVFILKTHLIRSFNKIRDQSILADQPVVTLQV